MNTARGEKKFLPFVKKQVKLNVIRVVIEDWTPTHRGNNRSSKISTTENIATKILDTFIVPENSRHFLPAFSLGLLRCIRISLVFPRPTYSITVGKAVVMTVGHFLHARSKPQQIPGVRISSEPRILTTSVPMPTAREIPPYNIPPKTL